MSDEKTKEQLLAEIEALKKRLETLDNRPAEPVTAKPPEDADAGLLAQPITRRSAFTSWVAPVILSVQAVQTATMLAATVFRPGAAQAAITRAPTRAPTKAVGRCVPAPTAAPTLGMASAPDGRPYEAEVALGSARAKLAKRRSVATCVSLSA